MNTKIEVYDLCEIAISHDCFKNNKEKNKFRKEIYNELSKFHQRKLTQHLHDEIRVAVDKILSKYAVIKNIEIKTK